MSQSWLLAMRGQPVENESDQPANDGDSRHDEQLMRLLRKIVNRIIGDKIVDEVRHSENGEPRNRNNDGDLFHARSMAQPPA
jgi:hypothetical protein